MKLELVFACATMVGATAAFTPATITNGPQSSSTAVASTTESSKTTKDQTQNMFGRFVDEQALYEQSDFPIKPDDLIARARHVLSPEVGIGTKDGGACLAEDFEFCAAVVGPIDKKSYLGALGSFNLEEAFDIAPNFYGLYVDPMQPNRVYFFNRIVGTHVGEFRGVEATGKEVVYPPQVHHLDSLLL